MYHSSLNVFTMNNMPGGMKKHCESNKPESRQMAKNISSSSSSSSFPSSDMLVQNNKYYMTLSWRLLHKTAAFYTEQCTSPSFFSFNFEVSQGGLNQSLKNYGFIRDAIFTCTYVHQSLSNETIIIQDIAELEKLLCAWRQGESLSSIVDSVFELWTEPGQWFFSQYCWGSLWGQTCYPVTGAKLQLKLLLKKCDINKIKKIKNVPALCTV